MNAYEACLTRDEIEHPYANVTTMLEDKRRKAEQLSNTLFSKLTKSPRSMAHAMVSRHVDYTADGYRVEFWRSSILPYIQFDKYADAVEATLTKLLLAIPTQERREDVTEGEANNAMYIDGKCGSCGSMNVSFNCFDADEHNKGFQEFTCRDCGATTYQTFVYTIIGQEVTTTEEKEQSR